MNNERREFVIQSYISTLRKYGVIVPKSLFRRDDIIDCVERNGYSLNDKQIDEIILVLESYDCDVPITWDSIADTITNLYGFPTEQNINTLKP